MSPADHTALTQEQFDQFAQDLRFLHVAVMALARGIPLVANDTTELLLAATRLQAVPVFLVPQIRHELRSKRST